MTDLVSRLLPCAHCGGQPLRDSMVMEPTTVLLYEIMCEDCAMQTGGHTTSEAAAEAWNRRVPDQQAADRIKALEQIIRDWRDTPGNWRNAAWWNQWTAAVDAALSGTVAPPDGLVEALELIERLHIPDQPSAYHGSELEWAQRHVATLRSTARAALAARKDKDNEN